MQTADQCDNPIRFGGVFELDLQAGELRKCGQKLKIQGQPIQILAMLVEHPGQVITREQVRRKLWPSDTFVGFDHGLNNAVNRLREALGDSADAPRFIETLPRKGYRFISPVDAPTPPAGPTILSAVSVNEMGVRGPTDAPQTTAAEAPAPGRSLSRVWIPILAAVAVIAAFFGFNVASLRERFLRKSHGGTVQSIVVLPLENLSSDPSQEYFTDGMTDALITDLAKISSLRVISRTSAMYYKGTRKSLPEIARELNVDAVVEGTVVRSGDRVRITAQLVLAPSDRHLWADAYDRDLRDILILQNDVARDIVKEIKAKLTPQEQARTAGAAKISPEAHDLYLKGLYQWFKQTPEGYEKSRAYFQQAVETDPSYAPGYTGLAYYYAIVGDEGLLPPREAWTKQRAANQKALELDPTLADVHLGLAAASLLYDWDWPEAEKEFKRSLEMNPSGADTHREYAVYLRTMRRVDEAIAEARRAQDLDPLSVSMSASLGWNYYYAHRYDEAIQQFRKTLEMDANFLAAHEGLAKCYQRKGMEKEVIAELQAENILAGNKELAGSLEQSYGQFGYERTMRVLYQLEIEELQGEVKQHYVSPMVFADLYALLKEDDQAFAWLEKAYQERSSKLLDIKLDPDFDSLRSDPRFQELVRRVGLPG